jgi:hypothetical protein
MIKCPHCQATLPEEAVRCQFCGAQFAPVAGPKRASSGDDSPISGAPKWVRSVYYIISGWWVLNGLFGVLRAVLNFGGPFGTIGLIMNVATLLIGLGLIFNVELARGIVNVLCFLNILTGAFGLIGAIFISPIAGPLGILLVVLICVQIILSGLMIYVISEIDIRSPNF